MKNNNEHFLKLIFDKIALKYDVTNDFLSFGLINYFRKLAIKKFVSYLPDYGKILDVGVGSGKMLLLTYKYSLKFNKNLYLYGLDFSEKMLDLAEKNFKKKQIKNYFFRCCDASALNKLNEYYDGIILSFFLRNFFYVENFVKILENVINDKSFLLLLELVRPKKNILLEKWMKYVITNIGGLINGNKLAYEYLVDSIYSFYNYKQTIDFFEKKNWKILYCKTFIYDLLLIAIFQKKSQL